MEINPSSSPNPNPAVDDHDADVTLALNNLQLDHPAVVDNDDDDDVTLALNKFQVDQNNSDSDSDDEFTFMCVISDDGSVTTESDKSGNNRRHPVFPLFDQSLLLTNDDGGGGGDRDSRLTSHVPVNKVFIETESGSSISKEEEKPSSSSSDSTINIKSNSTGFSKLWRFRNEMNRSHSDGRDAYVFLQSPNNREDNNKGKTSSLLNDVVLTKGKSNDVVEGEEGKGKKKVVVVKKGMKVKKSTESAHEVYLKQKKGGRTEEERRRSYLPYRPGLMGFFTNVNGGLSKNVHPF